MRPRGGEIYRQVRKVTHPQIIIVNERSDQNKGTPAFSNQIKGTSIIAIPGDHRRGIQYCVTSSRESRFDNVIAISSSEPASPCPQAFRISEEVELLLIFKIGILLDNPSCKELKRTTNVQKVVKTMLSEILLFEPKEFILFFKNLNLK
jgi:hypothetical protein